MSERKPFTFPFTEDESADHNIVHEHLLSILPHKPSDFEPWGDRSNDERGGDCSCGCVYYLTFDWPLGADWGVCSNPASARCGLLTFEHQGCPEFTYADDESDDEVPDVTHLAKTLRDRAADRKP